MNLLVGTLLGSGIGYAYVEAIEGIFKNDAGKVLAGLIASIPASVAFFPVVFPFTFVPITVSYVILRAVASHVRMTIPRRLAVGALLGGLTVMSFDAATSARLWDLRAAVFPSLLTRYPFTVYVEMELSAIALALVARPRWFGIVPSGPE